MTISTPSIELEIGSDALFWICFALATIGYIVVGCVVAGLAKRCIPQAIKTDADLPIIGAFWPIGVLFMINAGLAISFYPVFDFLFGWIYRIAAGEGKEKNQ